MTKFSFICLYAPCLYLFIFICIRHIDFSPFFIGKVTREMIAAEETVHAIRQLTETFDEESHEYPLTATGPASKKFKVRFQLILSLWLFLFMFFVEKQTRHVTFLEERYFNFG